MLEFQECRLITTGMLLTPKLAAIRNGCTSGKVKEEGSHLESDGARVVAVEDADHQTHRIDVERCPRPVRQCVLQLLRRDLPAPISVHPMHRTRKTVQSTRILIFKLEQSLSAIKVIRKN